MPRPIASDYEEACSVLNLSPKASAALSRRALQHVLRERGYRKKYLWQEIDEALESKSVPSHVREWLDVVRELGNIAAHPTEEAGAILEVEASEAEAMLDTLETLFDFWYVQPAKSAAKLAAIRNKIGRPAP